MSWQYPHAQAAWKSFGFMPIPQEQPRNRTWQSRSRAAFVSLLITPPNTESGQQLLAGSLAIRLYSHPGDLRTGNSLGELRSQLGGRLVAVITNARGDFFKREPLHQAANGDVISPVKHLAGLLRDQFAEFMQLALQGSLTARRM